MARVDNKFELEDVLDMISRKIQFYKINSNRIEKIEVTNTKNILEFKVVTK